MTSAELSLLPRPRRMSLDLRTLVAPGMPEETIEPALHPEGYRLGIGPDGAVSIYGGTTAGIFYGRATLDQLVLSHVDGKVPVGTIEDWPDLAVRGVMLDVSRCRVPTMETIFAMVDRLASWKINHLQLYMEHTFAYRDHKEVWDGADPFTAEEMAALGAYCRDRHIELAANQNTLGHMERWLVHNRYSPLGILRGVGANSLGLPVPASTLDPANPGSLDLVRELLEELGRAVSGSRFHVGLDEPWDLPRERSSEWVGWARAIRSLPSLDGNEMLVWGDMPSHHPELAADIPEGVTVCEWGYEAGHPFAQRGGALAAAGVPHWMCPGTSSWLSLLGRITNAVENCRSAAKAARITGAAGMLVTDWGDFGHHQVMPIADPGLAAGAAFAWCEDAHRTLDAPAVGRFLSRCTYGDPTGGLGSALVALGDVHRLLPLPAPNLSTLILHLYLPQLAVGIGMTTGLTVEILDAIDASIDQSEAAVSSSQPSTSHGRLAVDELILACRFGKIATRDARERLTVGGQLGDVPESARRGLADDLDAIIDEHRRTWLLRDRPGGLDESCAWLEHLHHCYATGGVDSTWAGPLVERARSATNVA